MPIPVAWSSRINANYRFADSQKDVRFVQLINGDFWMIWTDLNDTGVGSPAGTDLIGQRFNAFGVPQGGEVRLTSQFSGNNEGDAAAAAYLGSSGFVVAYEFVQANGIEGILLDRWNADGSQAGAFSTLVAPPMGDTSGLKYRNPNVALSSDSVGLVVFEASNDTGNTDIIGFRFNPTTGMYIDDTTLVNSAVDNTDPQVAVMTDGRFVVVYVEELPADPSLTDIRGLFLTTTGVLTPFTVSTHAAVERDPSIAVMSGGNFVVTWTAGNAIFCTVLDPNGATVVNTLTIASGSQLNSDSRVVAIGPNSFLVAWENATLNQIKIAAFDVSGNTILVSGSVGIAANNLSVSDLDLIPLADGRVLLGYDSPLATAQIFDPRASINNPAVYAPVDQQIGTVGNDIFTAAANADIVHGWDGNDIITDGGGTEAQYFGGEGNDFIRFSFVDAAEFADGGNGRDSLVYTALAGPTTVDLAAGTATTGAITQTVINFEDFYSEGVSENVTVTGGAGFNLLSTGGGADLLNGGAGADEMRGGDGNDIYILDDPGDHPLEFNLELGGIDEVRTNVGSRADPVVVRYVLHPSIENLTGTLGAGQALEDNFANNVITTGVGADLIVVRNGGDDTVSTGSGADFIFFGSALTALDNVDAGTGRDKLGLHGDYTITLAAGSLTGVEKLLMWTSGNPANDFDYSITTHDGNVAAGVQLEVTALSLAANETLVFNGAAETNGSFWVRSGSGNDTITGGAGNDRILGGMGGDRLTGGGGADRFDMLVAAHSTGLGFDTLVGFDASADRINVAPAFGGWGGTASGHLDAPTFDSGLAFMVDPIMAAYQAVKVTPTSGNFAGKVFVVFDVNGDGSYVAGEDLVWLFENPVQSNLETFNFFI